MLKVGDKVCIVPIEDPNFKDRVWRNLSRQYQGAKGTIKEVYDGNIYNLDDSVYIIETLDKYNFKIESYVWCAQALKLIADPNEVIHPTIF